MCVVYRFYNRINSALYILQWYMIVAFYVKPLIEKLKSFFEREI